MVVVPLLQRPLYVLQQHTGWFKDQLRYDLASEGFDFFDHHFLLALPLHHLELDVLLPLRLWRLPHLPNHQAQSL